MDTNQCKHERTWPNGRFERCLRYEGHTGICRFISDPPPPLPCDDCADLREQLDQARAALDEANRDCVGLREAADRARRHPFAPPQCPECNWTNINLMNFGDANKSRWMCHGCAARIIAENERMRAVYEAARVVSSADAEWMRAGQPDYGEEANRIADAHMVLRRAIDAAQEGK